MIKQLFTFFLLIVGVYSCSKNEMPTADIIYENGNIWTVNEAQKIVDAVSIPIIALGGAGSEEDLGAAIKVGGAAAAAAGSLFVFQGPHRAILIQYPENEKLEQIFGQLDGS